MKYLIFILFLFLTSCVVLDSWKMPSEIAITEINNMHFLKVNLNEKETLLLIDTGASKSLLDISQANDFNFEYALLSRSQYIGIGGETDIYVVYEYKIKEIWITFLGADLRDIRKYFDNDGIYIAGILGSDFIKTYNVIIDFKKNIMYLNN